MTWGPIDWVRGAARLLVTAGALLLTGCGTMMNFGQEHITPRSASVFGGVGEDLEALSLPFRSGLPGQSFWLRLMHVPLGIVDLPFTVVGDTITLPWTVSYALSGPEERRSVMIGGLSVP